MKIFGFEITRAKAYSLPSGYRTSWWPLVREPFPGAWQRNRELRTEDVTAFHAVFACLTLIASDISKLGVNIIRLQDDVWQVARNSAFDALLRTPNHFQTYIQFWESWILSKLLRGNTYVLKQRDARQMVSRMYVLDPCRVQPLVSDDGSVWYQLSTDNLSATVQSVTVPASEIIHDRMNTFWHPLCGIPPLYAAWIAANQGLTIQRESSRFFDNQAIPGGILSHPGKIPLQTVDDLRDQWTQNYSGENRGKIAILGDGMKFEQMALTAEDAQLLEQAKATAEWVCTAFRVPPYKIGVGPTPSYNNIQALNVEYYNQCLGKLIEDAEVCLDQGLGLNNTTGVRFDIDVLFRMDTVSQIQSLKEAIAAGFLSPNEARAKLGYAPVDGGDSPMMQQQNFSLSALAERDSDKPFAKPTPAAPADQAAAPQEGDDDDDSDRDDEEQQEKGFAAFNKGLFRLSA